ncbi:phage major capsid protein [Leuconostoc citreum]|uniref:phage major capsid protein n=1 Tax=Leuconostoc citreum TaxID=33964 RepID=UPI000BFEAB01|nr:phage major capsid protein [Leuconostoc citreum]
MTQEIRSQATELQVVTRDTNGSTVKQIQGYAIMFNVPSVDLGGFTEVIQPTALANVDLSDVALVYAHQNNSILARVSAGNLTLTVDDTGLFFSAILPDTTLANDVYTDIAVGNIKGMSFAFSVDQDEWSQNPDGTLLHTVIAIDQIPEVTITGYPAYAETSVELQRSYKEQTQLHLHERNNNMAEDKTKPNVAPANKTEAPATGTDTAPAAEPAKDVDVQAINAQLTAITQKLAELTQAQEKAGDGAEDGTGTDDTKERDESNAGADDSNVPDELRDKEPELKKQDAQGAAKGAKNMATIVKNEQTNERANLHAFLKRDFPSITGGTVASDNSVALPKDILTPIEKPANTNSLIALANVMPVSAPSGDVPVLGATNVTLNTVEELQANPQLAKMQLETVSYKLSVKRGFLPVSQELLDHADTAVGIDQLIGDYASQIRDNTLVAAIAGVLKKAPAVTAKSFDDVKVAYNSLFKYSNKSFVVTKSAFDVLDTLKDNQGRYLLSDSIASPTGKQVLGADVYVVEDSVLGAKDGDQVMFVGDVKSFGLFPTYKDLRVKWTDSDIYGQKLQLVLENDAVLAQPEAGKLVSFNFAPAAAPAPAPAK